MFDEADLYCIQGVDSSDGAGNAWHMVNRLGAVIADRMELQVLLGIPPQWCYQCYRLRANNWMPGRRPQDGLRLAEDIRTDIASAKASGQWTTREGQPGPIQPGKVFWDETKQCAKPGCKKYLAQCCEALRLTPLSFRDNVLRDHVPFFDTYMQCFYEALHNEKLGMWSEHLVKATFWTYKKHLQRWTDADQNCIISSTQWAAVLCRVEKRFERVGVYCRPLRVSRFLAQCGARADHDSENPGKSSAGVRGKEQSLLMLTLPFVLPKLIEPEIQLIEDYYKSNPGALGACLAFRDKEVSDANTLQDNKARAAARARNRARSRNAREPSDANARHVAWDDSDSDDDDAHECEGDSEDAHAPPSHSAPGARGKHTYLCQLRKPVDPSEDIIDLLYGYVEIVLALRKTSTLDSEIGPLFTKITRWDEQCLTTLPFKSGQDNGWNFIKKHAQTHAPDVIQWVGCTENVCASVSENCHQHYVKVMTLLTNRHPDWANSLMMRMSMAQLAVSLLRLHAGENARSCDSSCSNLGTVYTVCLSGLTGLESVHTGMLLQ